MQKPSAYPAAMIDAGAEACRPFRAIKESGRTSRSSDMRQCMDSHNLHRRLNKVMGQMRAIEKMIDEDIPCEDILIQINAAKSALHKVGQVVLEGHLNHCVREGIEHGDADKTIADFAKALEQFSRMA
jgi:DNA-binding FrmR family transcriptional regulator